MRENDNPFYGTGTEDDTANQPEAATQAVYLGFDAAIYLRGKTPCQALPAVLNLRGVKFFMLDSDGNQWPVNRKYLADRMERGEYVWLSSERKKIGINVDGQSVTALQIKAVKDISLYSPEFKPAFSESKIESLLKKPPGSFFFKGRMRKYKQDGSVGKGQNYSTLKRLHAQRLAELEGNQ